MGYCVQKVARPWSPTTRQSKYDLDCFANNFFVVYQNNGNTGKENKEMLEVHPADRGALYAAMAKRGLKASILDRLKRDFPVFDMAAVAGRAYAPGKRIAVSTPGAASSNVLFIPGGTPAAGGGGGGTQSPALFVPGGGGAGVAPVDLQSIVSQVWNPGKKFTIEPGSEAAFAAGSGGGFLGMSTTMLLAIGGVAAVGLVLLLRRKKSPAQK